MRAWTSLLNDLISYRSRSHWLTVISVEEGALFRQLLLLRMGFAALMLIMATFALLVFLNTGVLAIFLALLLVMGWGLLRDIRQYQAYEPISTSALRRYAEGERLSFAITAKSLARLQGYLLVGQVRALHRRSKRMDRAFRAQRSDNN